MLRLCTRQNAKRTDHSRGSQLQRPSHGLRRYTTRTALNMVEKIVSRFVVSSTSSATATAGSFVAIKPMHVLTHDNTAAVISKFKSIGPNLKVKNNRQPVFALDHDVQNTSAENLEKYNRIERFAREHGIDFYPAGRGIGHQVMCEEGYAFPGTLVVGADSHSNMYGGLGCLGTPIVRTDAAAIWATEQTWWKIPPVAKVTLHGQLQPGVTGKDVIITLCGLFNRDEVLNHAVEFSGDGVEQLSIDERLTIANMTTEWGALAGVFPIDEKTLKWLYDRQKKIRSKRTFTGEHPRLNDERIKKLENEVDYFRPDPGAFYAKELTLDLSAVRPHVSGPNHVKVMESVESIEQKKVQIHKAYIVSCVNSRVEDLARAASVLKGKKVADGVELYVAAASSEVQEESATRGDWQTLLDAGARPLPAGCGPCIGLGKGLLQDGEVGISATNRNFKGRMGSRNALAYLASPEVVAASAIAGYIAMPEHLKSTLRDAPLSNAYSLKMNSRPRTAAVSSEVLPQFPKTIVGELLWCHQDNLNTDGIYAGKWTYSEVPPEKQAEVAMENYDPKFKELARKGDILVGGYNFGTGSSREQAVTSLKYKGLSVILAGSFSETYTRNAWNNGFICLEVPELVEDLKQKFGSQAPTVRTGLTAEINFEKSVITVGDKEYALPTLGAIVQELVIHDGLENWVKHKFSSQSV